ncbi:ORF5 [Air potato virus 1]|uniref:ORF5 n=1 Tax=Air potato virus 1 TaxID=2491018 RepID=A0A3G6V9C3_9CLOS|nr:ORF5 [Air potato virus 1]AZB50211.1 ORF5 [Air potato virus 1]
MTTPSVAEKPQTSSTPATSSGLPSELEERYEALVKKSEVSISEFLKKPSPTSVFDFTKIKMPKQIDPIIPGVVIPEHTILVFESLKRWGEAAGLKNTDADLCALVATTVQNLVSFSTSKKSEPKARNFNVIRGASKAGIKLSHADTKQIIGSVLSAFGYENEERQFGRSISSAIISMTSGGVVSPNHKVCISHGIPPQHYPYGADCILVDPRIHGYSASLASELGKMVAVNRSQTGNKQIYNLYENTTAAPQIFTGNPQAGGR